jgi:hypothetical protein
VKVREECAEGVESVEEGRVAIALGSSEVAGVWDIGDMGDVRGGDGRREAHVEMGRAGRGKKGEGGVCLSELGWQERVAAVTGEISDIGFDQVMEVAVSADRPV